MAEAQTADPQTGEAAPEHDPLDEQTAAVERQLPAVAPGALAPALGPAGPSEWQAMLQQANAIAHTSFVPEGMRGDPGQVLAIWMKARELQIGPMWAMEQLFVSQDGKVGMQAQMMVALARRAGHRIRVIERSHTACEVEGTRGDTGETDTYRYTVEDARRAGLIDSINEDGTVRARSQRDKPKPWELHTRNMLWARAVSNLTRVLWPDAIGGATYTPEELTEGWVDENGQPITVEDPSLREAREAHEAAMAPLIERWGKALNALDDKQRAQVLQAWEGTNPGKQFAEVSVEVATAWAAHAESLAPIDVTPTKTTHPESDATPETVAEPDPAPQPDPQPAQTDPAPQVEGEAEGEGEPEPTDPLTVDLINPSRIAYSTPGQVADQVAARLARLPEHNAGILRRVAKTKYRIPDGEWDRLKPEQAQEFLRMLDEALSG